MKDASRYDLALKIYQKLINQLRKKIDPDARETDVDVVKRALMKAKEGEIRKDVNELHGNLLEMLHYHIEKVACEFFRAPDDLLLQRGGGGGPGEGRGGGPGEGGGGPEKTRES